MPQSADRSELDAKAQRQFFFLHASGPPGRRWLDELLDDDNAQPRVDTATALRLLREFDLASGTTLLASIGRRLDGRLAGSPTVAGYLRRWYLSAEAYLHYLRDDLAAADQALTEAQAEMSRILSRDAFLLPIAIECTDLVIQRARMARRAGGWAEVRAQLTLLRAIFAGEGPYCVLSSGRPIRRGDLCAHFAALPFDEAERRRAGAYLAAGISADTLVEQTAEQIYALPDVVIPYP